MTGQSGFQLKKGGPEVYELCWVNAQMGQAAEELVASTGVARGHRVLDVACGTGVVARAAGMKTKQQGGAMSDDDCSDETPRLKDLRMAARATIELFGNGAVAKTKERLEEVENEGAAEAASYWRALLKEVTRLIVSDTNSSSIE